jgi:hypothetical protein
MSIMVRLRAVATRDFLDAARALTAEVVCENL